MQPCGGCGSGSNPDGSVQTKSETNNKMNLIILMGYIAGILTTTANIPQLVKIYNLKEAKDISTLTYSFLFVGFILWTIYASYVNDLPLLLANVFSLAIVLGILILKFEFEHDNKKKTRIIQLRR